jgi:hypothetical protein
MYNDLGYLFHCLLSTFLDSFKSKPTILFLFFEDNHTCFFHFFTFGQATMLLRGVFTPAADLLSSFATIKSVMNGLYDGLKDVFLILLKILETREKVLEYIAEVINKNVARSGMQVIDYIY